MPHFKPDDAKRFVNDAFKAAGANGKAARIMADTLVWASLRGIESHGLTRTHVYLKRIEAGVADKNAEPEILKSCGNALLIDAHNALGQYASMFAVEKVCGRAEESGIAMAAVLNSNHFGTAGFYTNEIAKRGMIGICGSDSSKAMVLFGAAKPFLGTNPLSYAVPAGKYPPIILDMATSVVARGKIRRALDSGRKIPLGWAVGPDGKATDNPVEAYKGYVLPFGGPKGSGVALFVEILSSVLSGAAASAEAGSLYNDYDRPQGIGHFFIAIDPAHFIGREAFAKRMEQLVEEVKALPASDGGEVFLPGEIEHRKELENLAEGVFAAPDMMPNLAKIAEKYSVPLPEEIWQKRQGGRIG